MRSSAQSIRVIIVEYLMCSIGLYRKLQWRKNTCYIKEPTQTLFATGLGFNWRDV